MERDNTVFHFSSQTFGQWQPFSIQKHWGQKYLSVGSSCQVLQLNSLQSVIPLMAVSSVFSFSGGFSVFAPKPAPRGPENAAMHEMCTVIYMKEYQQYEVKQGCQCFERALGYTVDYLIIRKWLWLYFSIILVDIYQKRANKKFYINFNIGHHTQKWINA